MTDKQKYVLTDETKEFRGQVLHRIVRLRDGKRGGWLQSTDNLSQHGACWVADEAVVMNGAAVTGDALVEDHAIVCGQASVRGQAVVAGFARVSEQADVGFNARVSDQARVFDDCCVHGAAQVAGSCYVHGAARVAGSASLQGDVHLAGRTQVTGNVRLVGAFSSFDNAVIACDDDFWYFAERWPASWTRTDNMLRIGCNFDSVPTWQARDWHGRNGEYSLLLAAQLQQRFPTPQPAAELAPAPAPKPQPDLESAVAARTRPCRPGDVLVSRELPCGAGFVIEVREPQPGSSQVRLRLLVGLPTEDGGQTLARWLQDPHQAVLAEALKALWGVLSNSGSQRCRSLYREGSDVHKLVHELLPIGEAALALVREREAQQRRHEPALAAAYATWQVPLESVCRER